MRASYRIFIFVIALFATASAAPAPIKRSPLRAPVAKKDFWNVQRRGANCFNREVTPEWWADAKKAGIGFVRLAPDKWPSQSRDFLIGDADRFQAMVEADFEMLKRVLDEAHSIGMPVVLTMLSLPGARWRQNNGNEPDLRLWRDTTYWSQAASFWHELASRLRDHPAVVGYNIINEPTPELAAPSALGADPAAWYESIKNSAADLNEFYRVLVAAIRSVDRQTPILLDAGSWASASAFAYLKPFDDKNILYAFHMYEPWGYTNRKANGGHVCYPGMITGSSGNSVPLNQNTLITLLSPVAEWQQRNHVAPDRIIASEFGCHRMNCGVAEYLADLIQIFNDQKWHWAFYSFREDTWNGMDYELGDKPLGTAYGDAVKSGRRVDDPRTANRIWDAIRDQLK